MPDFLIWMAPCVVCGKMLKGGMGIFCVNFCCGRWSDEGRAESLNFREADNLVTQVEALTASGALVG